MAGGTHSGSDVASPRAVRASVPRKVSTAHSREGWPGPGHFWAPLPASRHPEDGARATSGLPGGETRNGLLARSPNCRSRGRVAPQDAPGHASLWPWSPGASVGRRTAASPSRDGRLCLGPGIGRPLEPPVRAEPLGRPVADPRTQVRVGGGAAAQNRTLAVVLPEPHSQAARPRRPAASPAGPGPHVTPVPAEAGAPAPAGGSGDTRGHKTLPREGWHSP